VATVPARFAQHGDPWAGIDAHAGSLAGLLDLAERLGPAEKTPPGEGRRRQTKPLVEVARTRTKPEAQAALQRWRDKHPQASAHLQPADVLLDGMRGRSSVWYRVRVNLEHVPPALRPAQQPLEADYDPWVGVDGTRAP
jgi:hypothetical protein